MNWQLWTDPANPDVVHCLGVNGYKQTISEAEVRQLAEDLERDYGHRPSSAFTLANNMAYGAATLGNDFREMLNA